MTCNSPFELPRPRLDIANRCEHEVQVVQHNFRCSTARHLSVNFGQSRISRFTKPGFGVVSALSLKRSSLLLVVFVP